MAGKINVITGPMRSSKTLDVILVAKEAKLSGKNVLAFHPAVSSRWGDTEISSRITDGGNDSFKLSFPSIAIDRDMHGISDIINIIDPDIIIFDDAQFFSSEIIRHCREFRKNGIDVYLSGLDLDFLLQPFGPMPALMSMADTVKKCTAICHDCQAKAQVSYRLTKEKEIELVGDDQYVPLCYSCYSDRKQEEQLDFTLGGDKQ